MSIQDKINQYMAQQSNEANPWDYLEFFIKSYPVEFDKVYTTSEPGSPRPPYKWANVHLEEVDSVPIEVLVAVSKQEGVICVPRKEIITSLSTTKADKVQLAKRVKAEFAKEPSKQEAYRKLLNITEESWNNLSPRYDTIAVYLFHGGDMELPREELLKTHVPITLEAYKAYLKKAYGYGNHAAATWCFRGVVDPITKTVMHKLLEFKNIPVNPKAQIPNLFYIEIRL